MRSFFTGKTDAGAFGTFADRAFGATNIDVAWICDDNRDRFLSWSKPGVPALSEPPHGHSRKGESRNQTVALIALGSEVTLCAHRPVAAPGETTGDKAAKPLGNLWVARILNAPALARLGKEIGGELTFVQADALPRATEDSVTSSRAVWLTGPEQLAVAWLVIDHNGKTIGYFRATVPVGQIYQQALSSRRTVLIIMSLSVGLVLLVIMGVHMLVTGPVVRLMRRLQQIEAGKADATSLTKDLHGEPLAVARRLESAFDEMDRISKTDQLTGLANRRHFDEVLQTLFEQARRYNRPLATMVIDIDFFKAINDAAGHQAGDRMIHDVGEAIKMACRRADLAARFGGDEFAVLLPESSAVDVTPVAERIRKTVSEITADTNGLEIKATCSIGISDLNSGEVETAGSLVNLADRALYAAKELGRNRYVLAQDLDRIRWPDMAASTGKVNQLSKKLAGLDTHFKDLFVNAVEELIDTLEERNPHMADHARKVRHLCMLIAREMEMPERVIKHLSAAAIMHDVGMLALPDSVLVSEDLFNEQQWQVMRRHPQISARIMEGMEFLEQEIPTVRYHHERYDGSGYPDGLASAEIPLPARILALADAFEAMTSPRAYREAKTFDQALEEVAANAGTQFDPAVADAFLGIARRLGEEALRIPKRRRARLTEQLITEVAADGSERSDETAAGLTGA